ncbi:hypothetical protein ACOI1C_19910 [Bacillus sp. DJP31]
MVAMWLTLLSLFALLMMGLFVFYYSIRSSVEPNDSHKIDPLPEKREK